MTTLRMDEKHALARVAENIAKMTEATASKYKKPPIFQGVIARFPRTIKALAEVSVFGSRKHQVPMGDMSYLDLPGADVMYKDAELRHMIDQVLEGGINHGDGGLPHVVQKAWDALADAERWLKTQEEMKAGAEAAKDFMAGGFKDDVKPTSPGLER